MKTGDRITKGAFLRCLALLANARKQWVPHKLYSVFTQYDGKRCYEPERARFEFKYGCLYAIARTLAPRRITELGCGAGYAAHPLIVGSNCEHYHGYDSFGPTAYEWKAGMWDPFEIAKTLLLEVAGDGKFRLTRADLRNVSVLMLSDLVYVDASPDTDGILKDLDLAMTANPKWIMVDDYSGRECRRAVTEFTSKYGHRIQWDSVIKHCSGAWLAQIS